MTKPLALIPRLRALAALQCLSMPDGCYLGEAPRRADDISREAKALALADGWDY